MPYATLTIADVQELIDRVDRKGSITALKKLNMIMNSENASADVILCATLAIINLYNYGKPESRRSYWNEFLGVDDAAAEVEKMRRHQAQRSSAVRLDNSMSYAHEKLFFAVRSLAAGKSDLEERLRSACIPHTNRPKF